MFLHPGIRRPDEVFHYEHSQNRLETWMYRLLGWFLMFLGYNCMSSILDIIGEYDDFLDQQQGYRIVILFLKLKYEHYSG